ncbi:uncharacterized protein LOC124168178 [Ischnura elegans]|uniref:uncharacterized protein LOC124168178 n=1 Tax=Ischnura elegans TaxID=197161 RepID=UPI001ED8A569|nr:uncharacterized protein LOC124168178 [Ischnura elegans]XP_046402262.1 uncharacterized protein LOC124168178 [Ischnura elegans]
MPLKPRTGHCFNPPSSLTQPPATQQTLGVSSPQTDPSPTAMHPDTYSWPEFSPQGDPQESPIWLNLRSPTASPTSCQTQPRGRTEPSSLKQQSPRPMLRESQYARSYSPRTAVHRSSQPCPYEPTSPCPRHSTPIRQRETSPIVMLPGEYSSPEQDDLQESPIWLDLCSASPASRQTQWQFGSDSSPSRAACTPSSRPFQRSSQHAPCPGHGPRVMNRTYTVCEGVKRVGWADGGADDGAEVSPGTVSVDSWGDGYGGTASFCVEPHSYEFHTRGTPPRVPAELLLPDDWEEDSYQTPSTARLRRRPAPYRRWKSPSAMVRRFNDTPLSRFPLKDEPRFEGYHKRICPKNLTDIFEEDAIEGSICEAACPQGPPISIPEGSPCPPDSPPDSWFEEEDECTQEVECGEGTASKSKTKVRVVTKEWTNPPYKYSSRVKDTETVEILLSPPEDGCSEDECAQLEGACGGDVDAAAAAADECHQMAEEAVARAREAAEAAVHMAMEAERAASRCLPDVEDERPEDDLSEGELEELRRMLCEEAAEVDLAVYLEKLEHQMRKQECGQGRRGQGGGVCNCSPRLRTEGESAAGSPREATACAAKWANSSYPYNLFQLLQSNETPEAAGMDTSMESIPEE